MRSLLLALTILAPIVAAGTASSPEITDGTNDVDVATLGWASVARPEIDIRAVWLDSNATHVTVHWSLVDLAHRTPGTSGAVYGLTYRDEVSRIGLVDAKRHHDAWSFTWIALSAATGEGRAEVLTGSVDADGIHVHVPRGLLQGTMQETRAGSLLFADWPWGGSSGGGNVWLRDAAPDSGHGRDYTP